MHTLFMLRNAMLKNSVKCLHSTSITQVIIEFSVFSLVEAMYYAGFSKITQVIIKFPLLSLVEDHVLCRL